MHNGHVPELLFTFGLSLLIVELVQLIWGRSPVPVPRAGALRRPAVHALRHAVPGYRAFMMLVSRADAAALWLLLTRTRIGLVIQAALTHPDMVEALGHNVPRVFMLVFGGGAALAGLAGVIGGNYTSPNRPWRARWARSSSWWWWSAAWARWPAASSLRC